MIRTTLIIMSRLSEIKAELAAEWAKPAARTVGRKRDYSRDPSDVRSYKKIDALHAERNQLKSNLKTQ